MHHICIVKCTQEEWDAKVEDWKKGFWTLLKQKNLRFRAKLIEGDLSQADQQTVASVWKTVREYPSSNAHFGRFFWNSVVNRLSLGDVKNLIQLQFGSVNDFYAVITKMLSNSRIEDYLKATLQKLLVILKELANSSNLIKVTIKVDNIEEILEYEMHTQVARSELLKKINQILTAKKRNEINFAEYCMYIRTLDSAPFPAKSSISFENSDLTITLEKIIDIQEVLPVPLYSSKIAQWVHQILQVKVDDECSFLDHLRRSPQLGLARSAHDYCHHTRFNYLQQFISNLTYLQDWGYGPKDDYIRRDLFILWFVVSQFGHTADAYLGERFLVWQLQQHPDLVDDLNEIGALAEDDQKRLQQLAKNGEWTQIHPLLAIIRLKLNNLEDVIEVYKKMDDDDYVIEKKVFKVVRTLTFIELDTRFSMSNIQVSVPKELVAIATSKHEIDEDKLAAAESLCEKLIRELQEDLYVVPAVTVMMQALSKMGDEFKVESGKDLLMQMFKTRITLKDAVNLKSLFSLPFPVSELKKSTQEAMNSPLSEDAQKKINKNYRIKCRDGHVFAWKAFTHEWSGSFTEYFFLSQPSKDAANVTLHFALYQVMKKMFEPGPKLPSLSEFDARVLKRSCVALAKFLWRDVFGTDVLFARKSKKFNWEMYPSAESVQSAWSIAKISADKDTANEITAAQAVLGVLAEEKIRSAGRLLILDSGDSSKDNIPSKEDTKPLYLMPIGGVEVKLQRNTNIKREFDGLWFEIHGSFIRCTVIEVKSGKQTESTNEAQFKSAIIDLNMGNENEVKSLDPEVAKSEELKSLSVRYFSKTAIYTI